ncbi:fascin domain-containing protein [Streptomyces sp. NPDC001220]
MSLLAAANGRYVTAEDGGGDALIADRTAIGTWEQFDLATV